MNISIAKEGKIEEGNLALVDFLSPQEGALVALVVLITQQLCKCKQDQRTQPNIRFKYIVHV